MGKKNGNGKVANNIDKSSGHLCGARTIARIFGVSRSTVAGWKEAGAPISQVGKSYQASYSELWNWLKAHEKMVFEHL